MGLFDGIKSAVGKVFGLGEPDSGDVTLASGPARGDEPAESQIVPWADDFLEECTARLAEFNKIADKDSPDFPGALADIVNKLRDKYEALDRVIPYQVRKVMGDNIIGPEAYKKVFGARDLGEIPPIPAHITKDLLSQKCELTQDGRTIAETHRLVFIPTKIDGEAFTLTQLAGLAEAAGKTFGRPKMFDDAKWFKEEPFANTPKEKGEWLLVPMTDLPNSREKSYREQQAELQKYPSYRGASILELLTTLIMNDLILRPERKEIGAYYNTYARCTDTSTSGARVGAGGLTDDGLDIYGTDDHRSVNLGVAIIRK